MSRLEFLIRQNKRSKEIENCKRQFVELLNSPVNEDDFLSLDKSDLLTSKFYDSYKKSNNKQCEKYSSGDEKLVLAIENLRLMFSGTEGYLITKQTETCGLLKVSIDKILKKYIEVIELDGDSLCILSIDESEGIYVDYFEEVNEEGSLWVYEVCFWKL